jgi:hypothetical protein
MFDKPINRIAFLVGIVGAIFAGFGLNSWINNGYRYIYHEDIYIISDNAHEMPKPEALLQVTRACDWQEKERIGMDSLAFTPLYKLDVHCAGDSLTKLKEGLRKHIELSQRIAPARIGEEVIQGIRLDRLVTNGLRSADVEAMRGGPIFLFEDVEQVLKSSLGMEARSLSLSSTDIEKLQSCIVTGVSHCVKTGETWSQNITNAIAESVPLLVGIIMILLGVAGTILFRPLRYLSRRLAKWIAGYE